MTSNLYNPAMQAALSETVAMKVMPVGQPVSAMVCGFHGHLATHSMSI